MFCRLSAAPLLLLLLLFCSLDWNSLDPLQIGHPLHLCPHILSMPPSCSLAFGLEIALEWCRNHCTRGICWAMTHDYRWRYRSPAVVGVRHHRHAASTSAELIAGPERSFARARPFEISVPLHTCTISYPHSNSLTCIYSIQHYPTSCPALEQV